MLFGSEIKSFKSLQTLVPIIRFVALTLRNSIMIKLVSFCCGFSGTIFWYFKPSTEIKPYRAHI